MIRIEISEKLKTVNVFTSGYDINFLNDEQEKKGLDSLETKMDDVDKNALPKKLDIVDPVKNDSIEEVIQDKIEDTPDEKSEKTVKFDELYKQLIGNFDQEIVDWLDKVGHRSFSKWLMTYPVDFLADEINNAYGWCVDNNKIRKKPSRFLTNWFSRSDNPLKNGKQLEDIFTNALEKGKPDDLQSH